MKATIQSGNARAYTVPTDAPEADGTISWDKTTIVIVTLEADGVTGLGYTYADPATASVANMLLKKVVHGANAFDHGAIRAGLRREIRNLGETGIAAMAISAIDNALWDLRARLLHLPLVQLLGQTRPGIAVYGSGGFTSYSNEQLTNQLGGWAKEGFWMVKMKIGTHPEDDPRRVAVARAAIGPDVQLFVDANGAYTVKQALMLAEVFREQGVRWFEEPVSSDDLSGLNRVRNQTPHQIDVAAGEYGYAPWYFAKMIAAGAVDVLQADATRCGGISGFLDVAGLCWAHNLPLSAHCGPSVHLHVCCAVQRAIHMEFFHDHARIERMFFEGFQEPVRGVMSPDLSRPGMGLELRQDVADKYAAS